jgi:hypothetical protein
VYSLDSLENESLPPLLDLKIEGVGKTDSGNFLPLIYC